MNRRTVRVAVLAALTLVTGLSGQLQPSAAQEGPAPAPRASMTVLAIDTVVGPGVDRSDAGWRLLVEQRDTAPWQRLTVTATLHAQLGSRSALRAALAGGVRPAALRTVAVDLQGPFPPGNVIGVDGAIPLDGLTFPAGIGGVHPLRFAILADGIELARIDTAVVRLATRVPSPLLTSLVWPVDAAPSRGPDGRIEPGFDVLTEPGSRLDTLIRATGPMGSGVVLAPAVHVLEDLDRRERQGEPIVTAPGVSPDASATESGSGGADAPTTPPSDENVVRPDGPGPGDPSAEQVADEGARRAGMLLARLRAAILRLPHAPAATPYGDADLAALIATGAAGRELAALAVSSGSSRLDDLAARTPSRVSVVHDTSDPRVLDLFPSGLFLLPFAAFDLPPLALDLPLGDAVRRVRSPAGRDLPVVIADPYLTEALGASTRTSPRDPVLAAHELLVRTGMVFFEAPGRSGRSLLLLPPPDFDPDPRFAATVLAGLTTSPWLAPVDPEAMLEAAPTPLGPVQLAPTPPSALSSRVIRGLEVTRAQRDLLVGAVDVDALVAGGATVRPDGSVAVPLDGRLLEEIDDELLRATSRALRDDPERSVVLIDGARAAIDRAFGTPVLTVLDLTLTDRDGRLPLAVTSTSSLPLRLRLDLTAPAALTWPEGTLRVVSLAPGGEQGLELAVRSTSTGSFPVTVSVTDPTATRLLAVETVAVRATALARAALTGMAAVIAALTILGTIRQRRRGRRRADVGAGSSAPARVAPTVVLERPDEDDDGRAR